MIIDAEIKSRKLIAERTWEVTFSHDIEEFYFNAGQYVWIITPFTRKAFSISSSSSDFKNIQIIFREDENSEFKKYLLNSINKNIKIRGPFGFMRVPKKDGNICYIAGGVGIAPALSIIRRLNEENSHVKINLIFANHSNESSFYIKELQNIPNLIFKNVIGKIQKNDIRIDENIKYYILGPSELIDGVYSILVTSGVKNENISFEENYPNMESLDLKQDQSSYFKTAVDQSFNHMIITDVNGFILYANHAAELTTGFTFTEMVGQTPRLWGGLMDEASYKHFWRTIKEEKVPYKGELKNQRKNGDEYYVTAVVSPILNKGKLVGFLGMEEDVTERKRQEVEFKKLNDLTINRELKMIELKKLIKQ